MQRQIRDPRHEPKSLQNLEIENCCKNEREKIKTNTPNPVSVVSEIQVKKIFKRGDKKIIFKE